ncbi:MAG: hypothetical protein QF752_02525 [Planctomycetota bacterium]|jgi:hypothetical protein|nr:hypothetical protein [Planctomycetota bacterium]
MTKARIFFIPIALIMAVLYGGPMISTSAAWAQETQFDEDHIYHGDSESYEKAGVISADKVYMAIPAYRRVVEEGMKKDNPSYWILMEKATKMFHRSLVRNERENGFDLVGEIGSIRPPNKTPEDITNKVVTIVRRMVNEGENNSYR